MTIYLDTNIFLYLSDKSSLYYKSCRDLLYYCRNKNFNTVTSVETFQEIIHYAKKIKRTIQGLTIANGILRIVTDIDPLDKDLIVDYLSLVDKYRSFESRDLIHLATALKHPASIFISYDRKFKKVREIKVFTPEEFLPS